MHSIAAHYVLNYGTEEQKQRWLPRMASGELIGAIAMTEPGAGSDLKGIRTRAVREGGEYVINGSKIFITNGSIATILMLVVRTDPGDRSRGLSILMVETEGLAGYRVGRVLDKMGMTAQDTSELYLRGRARRCGLPARRRGRQGHAPADGRPAVRAPHDRARRRGGDGGCASPRRRATCSERKAFGQAIGEFQNTRFKLAEVVTLTRVARTFVDRCIEQLVRGELDTETAAMAKWWVTDVQQQVMDECVQLHGGYGYMNEYLVCRMFADSRVQRIYGGTNEIMKELISRSVLRGVVPRRGLEPPRCYPLVPETSASTNSATWASVAARPGAGRKVAQFTGGPRGCQRIPAARGRHPGRNASKSYPPPDPNHAGRVPRPHCATHRAGRGRRPSCNASAGPAAP